MFARRILIAVALVSLIAGAAGADVKMTQKQHTDAFAMMGQSQPASDETAVIWVGKDRMRSDSGGESLIIRLDQKKMYMVDHRAKSFSAVDLPVDMKALMPAGMYEQMLQMMQVEAKVTPTDETAQIAGSTARKYLVTLTSAMMQAKQEVWATTDFDVDYEAFQRMTAETLSLQPGAAGMAKELAKINGVQVRQRTVMSMMGTEVVSSTEVTSAEDVDVPATTYEPPAGYNETRFDIMAHLQKGAK